MRVPSGDAGWVWRVTVYKGGTSEVLFSREMGENSPNETVSLVHGVDVDIFSEYWSRGHRLPVIQVLAGVPHLVLGCFSRRITEHSEDGVVDQELLSLPASIESHFYRMKNDKYYRLEFSKLYVEVRREWRKSEADLKATRQAIAFLSKGCGTSEHGCDDEPFDTDMN